MHIRAMAAVVVLGLISTGCATTYDPLRGRDVRTGVDEYCEPSGRTYDDGVRCAKIVRDAYVEAMVDDAVTSDRVAMALIPLGAAAIGLGVSGVSGAPITGLALGGAAIYGGGRWLTSQERRQVFGTGAEACQCVIAASGPLKVPAPLQEALDTASRDLGTAVAALDAERATVQADVALSATPLGRELLKVADEVLAEARSAQRRAAALQGRIAAVGDLIVSAVQSVRIAVTKAAVGTAQDLRDLPDFLKSTVYGTFQDIIGIGVPTPRAAEELQSALLSPEDTKQKLRPLQDAIERVRRGIAALSGAMEVITVGDVSAEFAACLDSVKGVKAPVRLRILPSSLVRLAPNEGTSILITGGKAPYGVVPLWADGTDLQISGPPDSGPARVQIKAGPKLAGGPFFLSVRDEQNDVERTVRIEVKAAAPAPSPPGAATAEPGDRRAIRDALIRELPAAKWTGAKAGESWRPSDAAPWTFRLAFESDDAAKKAMASDNVTRRIKKEAVTVSVDGSDLVVTVPDALVKPLAQKAALNQWP
jgi:hypothetical protein